MPGMNATGTNTESSTSVIAMIDGVSGVHLGQADYPIALARKVLGPDAIIGATATTTEQARQAESEGATYVGFGPVYNTSSKSNPASVKGLEGLRRAVDAVSIPVIAIAGNHDSEGVRRQLAASPTPVRRR